MEMQQMLTYSGKSPKDMTRAELMREIHCQKFLLSKLRKFRDATEYHVEKNRIEEGYIDGLQAEAKRKFEEGECTQQQYAAKMMLINNVVRHADRRENKLEFVERYCINLDALIKDCKWELDRRPVRPKKYKKHAYYRKNPYYNRVKRKRKISQRKRNSSNANQNKKYYDKVTARDGMGVSWDSEKFMLIARDRGYVTRQAVVYAISNELNLERRKAELVLETGKFTWGQVLCLGALLEMTPKEFCDTFLAGYFVEVAGNYIAQYDNLNKAALLKRPYRPTAKDAEKLLQGE